MLPLWLLRLHLPDASSLDTWWGPGSAPLECSLSREPDYTA
ncbi:MAG: hypothetical protein QGI26_05210 [Myxococcota bacterium]|nr:hypothetical protein [Myxococcota bacterium]